MKPCTFKVLALLLSPFILAGCGGKDECKDRASTVSYAVYGEYAKDSNKLMQPDLNRRVFDRVEAQSGNDIQLIKEGEDAGCITLEKGTYRISGFSMVTMQDSLSLPHIDHNDTYPGYAIVYPELYEDSAMAPLLKHAVGIGCLSIPYSSTSSLFDCVYSFKEKTKIAVGHQSGHNLHDEVYLSVYEVNGLATDYHVVARIAITRIGDIN
ncbi:hypothetical protein BH11BAC7_BH11BAC7_01490 [soil metagenome]